MNKYSGWPWSLNILTKMYCKQELYIKYLCTILTENMTTIYSEKGVGLYPKPTSTELFWRFTSLQWVSSWNLPLSTATFNSHDSVFVNPVNCNHYSLHWWSSFNFITLMLYWVLWVPYLWCWVALIQTALPGPRIVHCFCRRLKDNVNINMLYSPL